jgi:RNA polymerase sigma factor (sigma-70 family)
MEDLVQDGVVAMCKAADKWDARKGMRFTGYASWFIKNSMKASLSLGGSAVALPQVNYSHSRAKDVLREMQGELGRMPTTGEFKKRSGMPGNFAAIMLVMSQAAESLEDPVFAHDEASPYQRDHVVEPRPGPDEVAESSDIRRWLDGLICGLNERERDVIQKRFGWHDDVGMVLDDIGDSRGVSREAVRQTQVTAIRKMRAAIVQGDLEVSARMVG